MTVHKAKGLEFPVVILPELHIQPQSHTSDLSMEPGWPLVYGPRSEDGQRPAVHTAADRLGRQQRRAELLRTYYVAATRHQDHLVLVGANKRSKDGRFPSGSLLAETDEALDLTDTMEAGADHLAYRDQADRPCQVTLRSIAPKPASRSKRAEPPGRALLAGADGPDQLADAILSQPAGDPPPLVGPLPAEPDSIELAVTALVDFQQCPMLYRWRYELRAPGWTAPAETEPPRGNAPSDRPAGLDAATLGTLYHRCMELLDLDRPAPADRLVARAADGLPELTDLGPDALDALADQFQPMLDDFLAGELADRLRSARRICRELDFVMALDSGTIRGQIDLIYLDAEGQWHIVDYKSDRVDVRTAAQRGDHYRLQMGLYALAAGRHLDTPPASACLYFLRPAAVVDVPVDARALAGTGDQVDRLVHQLARARRTGQFAPADRPDCGRCPYAGLCPSAPTP
jgi:ATP-dependent helicase/nuclease subunit A